MYEHKFIVKALEQGLRISQPISGYDRYDFITDYKGKLNKIQVKSAHTYNEKEYRYVVKCSAAGNTRYIADKEVDYIVAITKDDDIYVVPMEEIKSKTIKFYKEDGKGIYNKYKNRWDLLK